MKKELMEIIACPVCKGDLALEITKEDEKEIVSGSLVCVKCNHTYEIIDTIPVLLPFKTTNFH